MICPSRSESALEKARYSCMAPALLKQNMNTRKRLSVSRTRLQEALKILDYLKRYVSSEDTLEGIAQWWLLEQEIR